MKQHAISYILLYSFPYVKMELQAVCISEEIQQAEHFRLQPLDMQHRGKMNICSMKPLDHGDIYYHRKRHASQVYFLVLFLFLLENISTIL